MNNVDNNDDDDDDGCGWWFRSKLQFRFFQYISRINYKNNPQTTRPVSPIVNANFQFLVHRTLAFYCTEEKKKKKKKKKKKNQKNNFTNK